MSFKRPWKRYKYVDAVKEFTNEDPLEWKTLKDAKEMAKELCKNSKHIDDLKKIESIGEVIAFVFEEKVENQLIQPTIVYDYPIEISPLAKKCEDERFTERFEMFANGFEIGNNYTELTDPVDLQKRFVEEKKREQAGFDEAHQTDNDYLQAIEFGFPPTCGIAIGVDRLVMLLTDSRTIKEVISFPLMKPETKKKGGKKNTKTTKNKSTKRSSKLGIDRKRADELVDEYIKDPITKLHMIESGVIMEAVAKRLGENEEDWYILGLLHDIDWEQTKDDVKTHGLKMRGILSSAGGTDYLIDTIESHIYPTGKESNYIGPDEFKDGKREGNVQHALAASETLTGLIIASTLVQPDKKLASVKPNSLMKKYKSKSFAAKCDRNVIAECEEIGIPLDEFLELGLVALQSISDDLGL